VELTRPDALRIAASSYGINSSQLTCHERILEPLQQQNIFPNPQGAAKFVAHIETLDLRIHGPTYIPDD
jgi:hypothetical protein